ncbi:MAG: hypothetical protein ACRCZ2_12845 [Fusobacteriaceae bacterium]
MKKQVMENFIEVCKFDNLETLEMLFEVFQDRELLLNDGLHDASIWKIDFIQGKDDIIRVAKDFLNEYGFNIYYDCNAETLITEDIYGKCFKKYDLKFKDDLTDLIDFILNESFSHSKFKDWMCDCNGLNYESLYFMGECKNFLYTRKELLRYAFKLNHLV